MLDACRLPERMPPTSGPAEAAGTVVSDLGSVSL
jgi:hypothetical protein